MSAAQTLGRMHPVGQNRELKIGSVDVSLHGLILPMGLRIEKVMIQGSNLSCSYSPTNITAEEPGKLDVFVSAVDLNHFLNAMAGTGLKNISIEAKDGALHIRATKTVLIDVKAYAVCTLRIDNFRRLFVDLQSVEILGVGTKQLIQSQLDKINPVVDTADFPIPALMDTVEIVEGGIKVLGRVSAPE